MKAWPFVESEVATLTFASAGVLHSCKGTEATGLKKNHRVQHRQDINRATGTELWIRV